MLPPIPLSNNYKHSVNEEQRDLKTRSLIKANSQWHKAQLFRYFLWEPGYFNFCLNLQIIFLLLLQNMLTSQFLSHSSNKTLRKIHGGKDCRLCILLQISFRSLGRPYHVHPSIYIMMWFSYCSLGTWASHHVLFITIGMQPNKLYLYLQELLAKQILLTS